VDEQRLVDIGMQTFERVRDEEAARVAARGPAVAHMSFSLKELNLLMTATAVMIAWHGPDYLAYLALNKRICDEITYHILGEQAMADATLERDGTG
jgi:hypothetical protein